VDAIYLLKTVREQKVDSQALSLAVVKNAKDDHEPLPAREQIRH